MFLFQSCVWLRPVRRSNTACFGCPAVRLFGCSAARLFSCSAAGRNWWGGRWADRRLRRCRLHSGGSVRNRVPTRFSDQLSGPVSGLASGPASRFASGLAFGFAFRACFRICFAICFRTSFPGQLSGLASGSAFRMQVLFCLIVECEVWFRSGRRIRLRNFCRSSSRRRACNSLLPVFLDLRRVPMI